MNRVSKWSVGIGVLAVVVSLFGVGLYSHSAPPLKGKLGEPGYIQDIFVSSNGYDRWYKITHKTVSKVGTRYTVINNGVNSKSVLNGPGGVSSNVLKQGTFIYRIPGMSPTQAVAFRWGGKYFEAFRTSDKISLSS